MCGCAGRKRFRFGETVCSMRDVIFTPAADVFVVGVSLDPVKTAGGSIRLSVLNVDNSTLFKARVGEPCSPCS